MRDKIFFDTETTGVNTQTDRIVEISIIKTNSKLEVLDKIHYLLNPTMPIPIEASEVHGIYDKDVKNSPTFGDVSNKILNFIQDCDIAGYNSNRFDIPLLMEEFNRCGITLDLSNVNIIDIYQIELLSKPNSLSSVYRKYTGKDLEDAHSAESDTLATIEVLKHQLENLELPCDFAEIESVLLNGNPRLDLGGKLTYINEEVCWNIGKHYGKPISIDKSYLNWFLTQDVPSDFKTILKKHL